MRRSIRVVVEGVERSLVHSKFFCTQLGKRSFLCDSDKMSTSQKYTFFFSVGEPAKLLGEVALPEDIVSGSMCSYISVSRTVILQGNFQFGFTCAGTNGMR